jgi:phosphoribosyl 1,2-cyclic phosphodiesterase
VKLTFLGTRGYVEPKSRKHRRHTCTLVSYQGRSVLLDYGEDWLGMAEKIAPGAIVITHAHPDHAFGLRGGAPCPVYATSQTWKSLARFAVRLEQRRTLSPRKPILIENMRFVPFPVVHSIRAPAVGYRITAGQVTIFYVPDVVRILHLREAFSGIRVYVGDGATISRPLLRREKQTGKEIGHASIVSQLDWCARHGAPKMIVTHCGSAIVRADPRQVKKKLNCLAAERGVAVEIAYDGMDYFIR